MIKYFCLLFFISITVQAAEDSAFADIARLRQYPSGADEGELKVQPQLKYLPNKKKKQILPELEEGF